MTISGTIKNELSVIRLGGYENALEEGFSWNLLGPELLSIREIKKCMNSKDTLVYSNIIALSLTALAIHSVLLAALLTIDYLSKFV